MTGDPISESAKATQEVAKTVGKALDASRGLGGWLDRIFGAGIESVVARYWTDRQVTRRIEAAIYDWERVELLFLKVQRNKARGDADSNPSPKDNAANSRTRHDGI